MNRPIRTALLALAATVALAGCKEDPKPDPPKQPDVPVGHTELRDAIQRPIDRAKGVEKTIQDAKDKQDKQLEDQGG